MVTGPDPLLDEDGRCRKTDLLPTDCACAAHRGGEAVDLDEKRGGSRRVVPEFEALDVKFFTTAKFNSRCSLNSDHKVLSGEEIGLIVEADGQEYGWGCANCVRVVLETGDLT